MEIPQIAETTKDVSVIRMLVMEMLDELNNLGSTSKIADRLHAAGVENPIPGAPCLCAVAVYLNNTFPGWDIGVGLITLSIRPKGALDYSDAAVVILERYPHVLNFIWEFDKGLHSFPSSA
jgi:hypothetical protein